MATVESGAPAIDPRIKARRIAVRRTAGRRRLQRLADLGAVLLVALAFGGALRSPLLDVDRIEISGAGHTGDQAVLEALSIARGEALMDVDLGAAGERVAALPWVLEVALERGVDGVVSVGITERQPVAIVPGDGGDRLVDAEGRVLGSVDEAASLPVPLVRVTGLEGSTEPGDHVPASSRGVLAAASALSISAPGAVAELDAGGDELWARLSAGGDVRLGDTRQLAAKVQSLVTMLQQVDLSCLDVIDVRLPGSPVLTREDACS